MVTIESQSYSLSLSVKYRPLHTDLYHRHLPNVTSLYWQLKIADPKIPAWTMLEYENKCHIMQPILRFSTRTYNFEHQTKLLRCGDVLLAKDGAGNTGCSKLWANLAGRGHRDTLPSENLTKFQLENHQFQVEHHNFAKPLHIIVLGFCLSAYTLIHNEAKGFDELVKRSSRLWRSMTFNLTSTGQATASYGAPSETLGLCPSPSTTRCMRNSFGGAWVQGRWRLLL